MRRRERPLSGRRAEPEPPGGRALDGRAPGGDLGSRLQRAAAALGLALPAAFPAQAALYLDELERWQRVAGLTGYRDRGARARHLLLESLLLLAVLPEPAAPLLDIGSGPGIPGLILKLARPDWEIVLIEATRRRANFLRHVIRHLGLRGTSVHWGRAEALAQSPLAGRFQTVAMRAVAARGVAEGLAAPFLRADGVLVRALGPREGAAGTGSRREVTLNLPGELPWRRQFLIIRRMDLEPDVSRGTQREP